MNLTEFNSRIKGYKKGTYTRISYSTDVLSSVKASERPSVKSLYKEVVETVRLGCDYHNMKSTIEAKANGRGTREMYEAPVVEDLIYENKKNGTLYLRVGVVENNNKETKWFLNGKETTKEMVESLVVPSYFKAHKATEVKNIKLNNVKSIG